MKTSTICLLLLLGFNASTIGALEAAPKVLRGSSKIVAFEDYVKDNAQLDESQCLGYEEVCYHSSQCCSGLMCSAGTTPPPVTFHVNRCYPSENSVKNVSQELIEESHEAQNVEDSDMKEEIEDLLARRCKYNGEVCLDSSQCCNGLVCSGSRCRTNCGGGGNLCFNGADCCSGLCSGFRCRS